MSIAALSAWHGLIESRDIDSLAGLLADSVVFHSPVVHASLRGKEITLKYLTAAFKVLLTPEFRYVRSFSGSHDACLEFEVELGGIFVNGVDLIRWNDEDQIVDFKVMLRPLKAIDLVRQKMFELLSDVEVIAAGSDQAHQRLQNWRRAHPRGFVLNVREPQTILHRSGYCRHLGDANWDGSDGWPEMGNATKVVSESREALMQWAAAQNLQFRNCQGCSP